MNEYTLPIETYYSNAYPLNNLSNFYYKFIEQHSETTYNYYLINYRNTKRATEVTFNFCENLDTNNTSAFGDYLCTGSQIRCTFYLYYQDNNGDYQPITTQDFDYTSALSSCSVMTGLGIQPNYTNNYASNLWQDNYLDTNKWKTIEIQPSPSPEPEEPTGEEVDYTNWFILLSAILMLLVMYRFIGSLFSRGD